jgi:FkbM family methyltransferase
MAVTNDLSPFGAYSPKGVIPRLLAVTRAAGQGWFGHRKAFALRKIMIWLLRGAPVDVETFGARMRLYPYNNVSEKRILFTPQYFDEAERMLLASRMAENFIFIDIGANIGGYCLFAAANAGPGSRILAIEPQPDIFERLIYNIRQNDFANVKAIDCAVADKDGEIVLFLDRENSGETSMRIVGPGGPGSNITVPAKTLHTIVNEEGYDHIDAIKLDVEGAEDLILEPFFRAAPEALWPKLIMMEHLHQRWVADLPKLLLAKGYREVQLTKNNTAWERG